MSDAGGVVVVALLFYFHRNEGSGKAECVLYIQSRCNKYLIHKIGLYGSLTVGLINNYIKM